MKGQYFLLYLCDIIDCFAMTDQEELHENEERASEEYRLAARVARV